MYLSDNIPELDLSAASFADLHEPLSRAYIECRDAAEPDLAPEDFAEEDSWVLEDFDDLIPDHY